MYTIYAIYNRDHDRIYIGQTEDIIQRLKLHQDKSFQKSYTANFSGEWKLIYAEEAKNRQAALKREKQLKSYQGRQFVRGFI
ncbi:TPA: endonuclease [Patescibacteria group bacterium]|nr:endonuclease [Patescibacteria group bacterium]